MNQFEIVQKIGEGSYSTVYTVRRMQDKKLYAMKKVVIPFLSERERDNALNEIRIIASVKHPNIIAYKESFYDPSEKVLW